MNTKTIVLTSLLLTSLSAHATGYKIDPAHANVRFAIDHFATSTNTGGFYNLTGTVDYDPTAQTGYVDVTIPIDSLNTGNQAFNDVLKSKDFFDVEAYPTARFVSNQWQFRDIGDNNVSALLENSENGAQANKEPARVDGMLTLNGITKPVSLLATKFNCYFSPIHKAKVCGGDFITTIDRTDWDIDKYVLMGMTKYVTLNVQIEAVKQ